LFEVMTPRLDERSSLEVEAEYGVIMDDMYDENGSSFPEWI